MMRQSCWHWDWQCVESDHDHCPGGGGSDQSHQSWPAPGWSWPQHSAPPPCSNWTWPPQTPPQCCLRVSRTMLVLGWNRTWLQHSSAHPPLHQHWSVSAPPLELLSPPAPDHGWLTLQECWWCNNDQHQPRSQTPVSDYHHDQSSDQILSSRQRWVEPGVPEHKMMSFWPVVNGDQDTPILWSHLNIDWSGPGQERLWSPLTNTNNILTDVHITHAGLNVCYH